MPIFMMILQFEGAFLSDGKGLNNWDVFTHKPGSDSDSSFALFDDPFPKEKENVPTFISDYVVTFQAL